MRGGRVGTALVVLLLLGCSGPSAEEPARRPAAPASSKPPTAPTAPTVPTADPTSPTAPPRRPRPVTIAVAGDVHFEGPLRERLADPTTALAPVTGALAAADVAVLNLETSLGSGGRPDPTKRFTFQAPPAALDALRAAGVDVASMANNHALDFGTDPLPDLFGALRDARTADPSLQVIGLGRDVRAAFRPALSDVDGTVVATLAATVADQDPTADPTGAWAATPRSPGTADALDPTRLLDAVRRADRAADVVMTYLHWGVQGERCPSGDQRDLAADLVAAGADVVVGSHAHLVQGDGRLGRGYVAYGLGNYAWYTQDPASSRTGVLTLTVRPAAERTGRARVTEARWTPALIGSDGLPAPSGRRAAVRFAAEQDALRSCAGLEPVR